MTELATAPNPGFNVRYGLFFLSLVVAGMALGYIAQDARELKYSIDMQLVGAFGAGFLPTAGAALIGLVTFSDKKRRKGGLAKMLIPTLVFSTFWFLMQLGNGTGAVIAKGSYGTPASDAKNFLSAGLMFALSMLLTWAPPVIVYLVRSRRGRRNDGEGLAL